MEPLAASIAAGARALDCALSAEAVAELAHLLSELERWNRKINLTAIREPEAMVGAHILDSLAVRPWLQGESVIDIGTGAGFPGLPLAVAEPDRQFVLLDSNGKKISFVQHIAGELGLENVHAVKARIEDYAPGQRFDTVIARALAAIPRLVELAGHLVAPDGQLLALKGKHPAAELDEPERLGRWTYTVDALRVPGLETHARHIVRLSRK